MEETPAAPGPRFLSRDEVLEIHRGQIERFGGRPGVRDPGLLDSALAMPAAGVGGRRLHDDLHEMAAAYLFHLAKNHPFFDGNKRVAAHSAYVFLSLNGLELSADQDAYYRITLAVADGSADKAAAAAFFRGNTRRI